MIAENLNTEEIRKELNNLYQIEEGESICFEIVQYILEKSADALIDQHFEKLSVPETIKEISNEILNIIDYVFIKRDIGEGNINFDESWQPDEEATPAPTDVYSRSTVPILQKEILPISKPSSEFTSRTASRTRTRRTRVSKLSTPYEDERKTEKLQVSPNPSSITRSKSATSKSKPKSKRTTQKEELNSKTIIERQKEDEKKMLDRIKFQLRGKDYTYDKNGEIIVINRLDASKLPQKRVTMRVDVKDVFEEKKLSRETTPKNKNVMTMKKTHVMKKKKSEYIWEDESLQNQMITDIVPAPGVTIKEGRRIWRGDPLPQPDDELVLTKVKKTQISRKQIEKEEKTETRAPSKQEEQIKKPEEAPSQEKEQSTSVKDTSVKDTSVKDTEKKPQQINLPVKLPIKENEKIKKKPQKRREPEIDQTPRPITPQQPAIIPVNKITKGMRTRSRSTEKSAFLGKMNPKKTDKLPPPIYPALYGKGFVTTYLGLDNPFPPKKLISPRAKLLPEHQDKIMTEDQNLVQSLLK